MNNRLELARMAINGLSLRERSELLAGLRPEAAARNEPPRLLRRVEVARRLSCSLRTVDNLARSKALNRVALPGRTRALGFLEAEVNSLVEVKP